MRRLPPSARHFLGQRVRQAYDELALPARMAAWLSVIPATLLAPLWLLERGLCAWLALAERACHGGIRYGGARVRVAAHSRRALRRRLAAPGSAVG